MSPVEARVIASAQNNRTSAARPASLSVRQVGLSYGSREILRDVSFDVPEGSILCFVGPSGCGKTTLIRLLAGLVQPTRGIILFNGDKVSAPSRSRAIVFQDYASALLGWRTVAGNVALSLESSGMAADKRRAVVDALLSKMGLKAAAQLYPSQLSGGMQQRVQIARCLAQQPKIMLMDEPFGALDAMTRQTLQDELLQIAAERQVTVVFITHDLDEAIYLGDRVIVLGANPGRIVETIDVDIPRPRDQLATREDFRFLSYRHRLFGRLQGH